MYYFNHNIGDRVVVSALPTSGDSKFNGLTGTVKLQDLDDDGDRYYPNVIVEFDNGILGNVQDHNLQSA